MNCGSMMGKMFSKLNISIFSLHVHNHNSQFTLTCVVFTVSNLVMEAGKYKIYFLSFSEVKHKVSTRFGYVLFVLCFHLKHKKTEFWKNSAKEEVIE